MTRPSEQPDAPAASRPRQRRSSGRGPAALGLALCVLAPGGARADASEAPVDPAPVLHRMARERMRPQFLDWTGRGEQGLDERVARFRLPWIPVAPGVRLLPVATPDAQLWEKAQQQWLAAGACPCLSSLPGLGPGEVPDGGGPAGVPLRVERAPGDSTAVSLSWGPSCNADATDYAVHEGTIGAWYSHVAALCTTGGQLSADVAPQPGNRYFLVVPLDDYAEGGYGVGSGGSPRPAAPDACRALAGIAVCPTQ